ncbi:two-component response regulator ARR12 [Cucumis sativus]|uniref:Two-component response regulator n=1 Tax=Cucumis sativus TaxID=3659 RepID=A0A0A0L5M6_CUCSA|nr:two-component response regulator ARR12 [Cucumis sativus]KGN55446.1 hypothetical protein Csa_012190 [Cucumis sativus]
MTVESRLDDPVDQFPTGMRVLAVDDDPTCLLILETLLRRCQYHVTTTNQAVMALKLLRENKNKFDVVISDVHMPDMDGFKLLELVGLEMDLPVIMLSANGDPKLVMKGITHGACDYLLKPVRIEELKNIWQHVIRRKKFDPKDRMNSGNQDRPDSENGEESADPNGKFNKKRKDQNYNEDDDQDYGQDNDDSSTQKKPRVVWSVELHRKFVNAVNQLGIDKAVPKKILDLMNVEKLTRENVASHLQKYRLYLKRISCVANQQANMVTALSSADPSYLRIGSLGGIGNFHSLTGPPQFPNTSYRSIPTTGMFGRLNSPACMGMHGLSSPGTVQLGNLSNSSNDQSTFQPIVLSGNRSGNIFRGMPEPSEIDQLQHVKHGTHVDNLSSAFDERTVFPSIGLPNGNMSSSTLSNPLLGLTNDPSIPEAQHHEVNGGRKFGTQSSISVVSSNSDSPRPSLDNVRCTGDNWSNAVHSSRVHLNTIPSANLSNVATSYHGQLRDNTTSALHIGNCLSDISSITSLSTQSHESRIDSQRQAATTSNRFDQLISKVPVQDWNDHKEDAYYHTTMACSSSNSLIPVNGAAETLSKRLENPNAIFSGSKDFNATGQANVLDHAMVEHDQFKKSNMETPLMLKQGYLYDHQQKMQSRFSSSNCGSLEDIACAMMKQEQDDGKLLEGEFGCDNYPIGTCM